MEGYSLVLRKCVYCSVSRQFEVGMAPRNAPCRSKATATITSIPSRGVSSEGSACNFTARLNSTIVFYVGFGMG